MRSHGPTQTAWLFDDPEICFWDETLRTAAMPRGMIEVDLSRKRRAEMVDRAAREPPEPMK